MTAVVAVNAALRSRLFELAAVLLGYPDRELHAAYEPLAAAANAIGDDDIATQLREFLHWFGATPHSAVEQHYVQVFDLRRRSGLYLTYYLHGDTRKRGIALLTLKQRYRTHRLRLRDGELPDFLPVVLEFAALAGPGDGDAPLRQHRRGVELLRAALADVASPYEHVLEAITIALPPLTDADRAAIAALAVDGPPVESMGLRGYGDDGPTDELASIGAGPDIAAAACSGSEVTR